MTPVHYFLDDIWVSLDPKRAVFYQTYFKKSSLNLYDNYFGFFNSAVVDYFYQKSFDTYFPTDINSGTGEGCYF